MLAYLEGRSTRISWACPVCQVPHVHYYNPPDITMRCAPHFTDEAAEIQRDFRASPRWSYWSFTTLWVSRIWVIVDLDKKSSSTGVVENESHIGWGWRENGSLGCKDWKCRQFSKTQKVSLSFFSLSVSPHPIFPFCLPLPLPPLSFHTSVHLPLPVPAQIHPPNHSPMRWLLWFVREYQICPAQLWWTSPWATSWSDLGVRKAEYTTFKLPCSFCVCHTAEGITGPLSRLLIVIFLSRDPLSSVIFVTGYSVESAMYKYDMFKLYIAYYKIS